MKYKIGEVSKILNIPKGTLRFFETKGIVTPVKDCENNYRYYEAWDINYLIEYQRYRSFDFDTNETQSILHSDDMGTLKERMTTKLGEIDRKLQYYKLLKEKSESYIEQLDYVDEKIGTIQLMEMPLMRYFLHRFSESDNDSYHYDANLDGLFAKWIEYFPFTDPILRIEKDDFLNRREENIYQCGLALHPKYFEAFGLENSDILKTTKKQLCLNTVIHAGGKHTFHINLLECILEFMTANDLELSGDIIGVYVARVHEGSEYNRFIEFWAPVEQIESPTIL